MTIDKMLLIGDPHAHPDHHNKRFDWLGQYILDERPDAVVCIGDLPDMPSLSSYDEGKKKFEGRRYKADIEAAVDAQERIWHPTKAAKKRLPKRYYTKGNHDDRITRAVESDAKLEGVMGMEDLQLERHWDEVYEYLDVLTLEGVAFSHFFTSGIMNRPIGGLHLAYSLLTKQHQSCIQGHSHIKDYCTHTTPQGKRLNAMSIGCFQDFDADWAGPANLLWWRGLCMIRDVSNGNYDEEWISMDRLARAYR